MTDPHDPLWWIAFLGGYFVGSLIYHGAKTLITRALKKRRDRKREAYYQSHDY